MVKISKKLRINRVRINRARPVFTFKISITTMLNLISKSKSQQNQNSNIGHFSDKDNKVAPFYAFSLHFLICFIKIVLVSNDRKRRRL